MAAVAGQPPWVEEKSGLLPPALFRLSLSLMTGESEAASTASTATNGQWTNQPPRHSPSPSSAIRKTKGKSLQPSISLSDNQNQHLPVGIYRRANRLSSPRTDINISPPPLQMAEPDPIDAANNNSSIPPPADPPSLWPPPVVVNQQRSPSRDSISPSSHRSNSYRN